jgi:DNA end-binding protein Ku
VPPRPSWRGFIRLSLVNVPVRLYPATASQATIGFNQLHRECGSRINMKRWCKSCEREVGWDDVVKGYEYGRDKYVTMEKEEIDNVRLETSEAIRLVEFVDADELPSLYVEDAHYLVPDGRVAGEAYAVLREAMKGKVGIGKLVQNGRERVVAIQPWDRALVMYTLHYADEVRTLEEIGLEAPREKPSAAELALARQLVDSVSGHFDLSAYKDEYRDALMKVIRQKVEGEEVTPTYSGEEPQVIDLMEALKGSLDKAGKAKKKPARAELPAGKRAAASEREGREARPKRRARGGR